MSNVRRFIGTLAIAAAMTGCATTSNNSQDPFEGFNRSMFSFNDAIDQAALRPAATLYRDALPMFVQIAIGNFFGNIGDVWTAVNNVLQGQVGDGFVDVMRVAVNSTFGLGGLIDIGSEAGMVKHKEDFGQTLAVWGIKSGPYVVLPFLGSSTVRDSLALPVDIKGDPWVYVNPVYLRNAGSIVRVVDQRSVVLDASNLIEDAALDRYEFVRDAYLQRRESRIRDGSRQKPKDDEKSSMTPAPLLQGGAEQQAIAPAQLLEPLQESSIQRAGGKTDIVKPETVLLQLQEKNASAENSSSLASSGLTTEQLIKSAE
jgi:phospholipid-binding lipoprotein MlaA